MKSSKARLIALTVVCLALQPATHPKAAGAGRVAIRCSQACQQIQIGCDDRSDALCLAMFGDSEEKYVACRVSSKTQCVDLEHECRLLCVSSRGDRKLEP